MAKIDDYDYEPNNGIAQYSYEVEKIRDHKLQMDALRSNIEFNKRQNKFAVFNLVLCIINVVLLIKQIFFS
ncbi:hypothetical protein EZS27_024472 [termite gut metagenome]|uniref:Uncharacterized protein n=1 Tax=termite gut metagenome TaxID=433724 RepID=A0A5J4QWU7_9ZZZZ